MPLLTTSARKLLDDVKKAFDMLDKGQFQEAYDAALAVKAAASAEGITSPLLTWVLAAAADQAGDLLGAARFIEEAVALDVLSVPAARSLSVIQTRLCEALLEPDVAADKVGPLYTAIRRLGDPHAVVHVAYAKHMAAEGKLAEAWGVLSALVTLSRDELLSEDWELVVEVAERLGKMDEAAEARLTGAVTRCSRRGRFTSQAPAKA